jgi:hypothetical protein
MSARLAAFFFLLRQEPMPSLDELANAAGMTALDPRPLAVDRGTEVRYGNWGGARISAGAIVPT